MNQKKIINIYFFYLLFTIFLIYSILLSNSFNLKIFNLYKEIKNFINLLNNFNFIPLENSNINFKFYPSFNNKLKNNLKFNGLRYYSTVITVDSDLELSESENSN